jgi:hypothetical protein
MVLTPVQFDNKIYEIKSYITQVNSRSKLITGKLSELSATIGAILTEVNDLLETKPTDAYVARLAVVSTRVVEASASVLDLAKRLEVVNDRIEEIL